MLCKGGGDLADTLGGPPPENKTTSPGALANHQVRRQISMCAGTSRSVPANYHVRRRFAADRHANLIARLGTFPALHMSARGLRLAEVYTTICAVAGRCRQRHSDSDAFWGGRRRAPRRKQGMLIPLMVALISKLFCSQRLADYVELRGWSTRHRHVPQLIITSPALLKCWFCRLSQRFEGFWLIVPNDN